MFDALRDFENEEMVRRRSGCILVYASGFEIWHDERSYWGALFDDSLPGQ